jgi:TatD DNase family protein
MGERARMELFDSHCHLDSSRFDGEVDDVLARARAAGVVGFVLAGVDPEGWAAQEALCARHADVFCSVGVHPQVAAPSSDAAVERMLRALRHRLRDVARPRVVAIGEAGLDRLPMHGPETLPRQERAFREQLALAATHDLPIILHVLRAHDRALAILREVGVPARGGVLHSYSGSPELVPEYAELGLCFSFAGPVTFQGARRPLEAVRAVPIERLLLETDAPDQTPEPHRPGRNEPAFLPAIARAVAQARGVPASTLAAETTRNARRLFGFA